MDSKSLKYWITIVMSSQLKMFSIPLSTVSTTRYWLCVYCSLLTIYTMYPNNWEFYGENQSCMYITFSPRSFLISCVWFPHFHLSSHKEGHTEIRFNPMITHNTTHTCCSDSSASRVFPCNSLECSHVNHFIIWTGALFYPNT